MAAARVISSLVLIVGSMLILTDSAGYFRYGVPSSFIEEKADLGRQPLWLGMLYAHITSGLLALFASLLQFSRALMRRHPSAHRWLGRVYITSILAVLCPSGFYLTLFAKGGFAGRTGFLLLGVLTFHFTLQGFLALRGGRHDMNRHIVFMIRSFAMLTTAITFRIEHLAFHLLGLDDTTNYLVALWLSVLGNAAVAEWLIHRRHHRPLTTPRTTIPEST